MSKTKTHLAVKRGVGIVSPGHPAFAGEVGGGGAVVDRVVHPGHTPDNDHGHHHHDSDDDRDDRLRLCWSETQTCCL